MPNEDWLRSQKRHFKEFLKINKVVMRPQQNERIPQLNSTVHIERRHYCGINTKSHLNDFF